MPTVDDVVRALRLVIAPEIGINIVDLGLVAGLEVAANGDVHVRLIMTAPTCPLSEYLGGAAERTVTHKVPGGGRVVVTVDAETPWGPEMMSEDARRLLG